VSIIIVLLFLVRLSVLLGRLDRVEISKLTNIVDLLVVLRVLGEGGDLGRGTK
jgi:hypothetical protein